MSTAVDAPKTGVFSGQPRGLYLLFFTEMWERFCYYGMRALLVFYVAYQFTDGDQKAASAKYGAFTALVYATSIFGGAIADRLIGYQRAILLGGVFIAAGEFMLLVPTEDQFFLGLSLMIIGNGLFKPNISSIVGKLYQQGDPRRDQGFTIFYMGINLGALLAPIVCGAVRQAFQVDGIDPVTGATIPTDTLNSFRYGFATAGAGMLLGLVNFWFGRHRLGEHGKPPAGREGLGLTTIVFVGGLVAAYGCNFLIAKEELLATVLQGLIGAIFLYLIWVAFQETKVQREKLFVLILMLVANTIFWALFEQAGNSFNFFAENRVDRQITESFLFEATWFQSVNPILIVLLGPLFVGIWAFLERRRLNPSIPAKFGLGLLQVGLGFTVLIIGIRMAPEDPTAKAAFIWLWLTYTLHTTGELCISPVGLSMVTKLAPERMVGLVMGAWFISISAGNFLAGAISSSIGGETADQEAITLANYADVFEPVMWLGLGAGIVLLVLSPLVNRWMHGVK
jgi:POT family proton-dependent oligopeptide transporter